MSVDIGVRTKKPTKGKTGKRGRRTKAREKSVCNKYVLEADEAIAIKRIEEALEALDGNVDSLIRVFNFVIAGKKL